MNCCKKTHQVSILGFIAGFLIMMALIMNLTGCGGGVSADTPASTPDAPVESDITDVSDISETPPATDISDTSETPPAEAADGQSSSQDEDYPAYEFIADFIDPADLPDNGPSAEKEGLSNADIVALTISSLIGGEDAVAPSPSADTPAASVSSSPATESNDLPSVSISADTVIETSTETVYNFKTEGFAGCGLDRTVRSYELYYGIHATVDGSSLTYRAYSYDKDITPVKALFMRDSSKNYFNLEVGTSDKTIDLGNQSNDAFTLFVTFSNDTTCFMTIYINDGKPYIVDSIYQDAEYVREYILSKQDTLSALTEKYGVTAENSLGVTRKDFCYPVYPWNSNYRCDTDLWRELAHEIVTDDTLPDSLKAAMLHDWMSANLSYDYYLIREYGSFTGRQTINEDHSGTWSLYNTHTGICRDFVNVYAIMCRELGIPCSCLGNGRHTWNIIWLDGKWCDIDLTTDIQRAVYKEDVSDVTNADDTICYTAFLTDWFIQSIRSDTDAGQSFYTEKFATTGKQ